MQNVTLKGSKIAVRQLTPNLARPQAPNPGQPHLVNVDFDGERQPMSFQILKKLPRGYSLLFAGSQASNSSHQQYRPIVTPRLMPRQRCIFPIPILVSLDKAGSLLHLLCAIRVRHVLGRQFPLETLLGS